jgi:hypothetical protein
MKLSSIAKPGLTLGLLVAATLGMQTTAPAQSMSPSARSEQQGATTGLGSSHRFRTAAEAANHCPGDTIVWLSGPKLVYYLPGAAKYGRGVGQYACQMEADSAGFQSAGG